MRTAYVAVYETLADWEIGHLLVELRTGRFTGVPYTEPPARLGGGGGGTESRARGGGEPGGGSAWSAGAGWVHG